MSAATDRAHRMRTLQAAWEGYEQDVLDPIDAGSTQRQECRRAFYAGATSVLGLMMKIAEDDLSDDAGAALAESWFEETRAFRDAVGAGLA